MTQPPVPGRGAGAEPPPGAGLPGGAGGRREPDPRLAAFATGGPGDSCPPGAALAATLAELSGPGWRCDGATDDELAGLLGRWQAVESWAAAGKLGVVRELIRRRARPGIRGRAAPAHGDLPDAWQEGLDHEVSAGRHLAAGRRPADRPGLAAAGPAARHRREAGRRDDRLPEGKDHLRRAERAG